MATPRSIVDLLVEQSEESLREMRDARKAELARVTVEIEQIEEALTRKTRRKRTGGGKLTRDQVFDLVRVASKPVTAAEARDLVAEQGVPATLNAVRNHLNRLVDDDGRLMRYAEGRFGLPVMVQDNVLDDVPEPAFYFDHDTEPEPELEPELEPEPDEEPLYDEEPPF